MATDVKKIWEAAQIECAERNTVYVKAWNEYCPGLLDALSDLAVMSNDRFKFSFQNRSGLGTQVVPAISTNVPCMPYDPLLGHPATEDAWFIHPYGDNKLAVSAFAAKKLATICPSGAPAGACSVDDAITSLARTIADRQDYRTTAALAHHLK